MMMRSLLIAIALAITASMTAAAQEQAPPATDAAAATSGLSDLDAITFGCPKAALNAAVSIVDKMAKSGIIHRNTAGRYKSRLASHVQRASK